MTKKKIKIGRPRIYGKRVSKKVHFEPDKLAKAEVIAALESPSFNHWVCKLVDDAVQAHIDKKQYP